MRGALNCCRPSRLLRAGPAGTRHEPFRGGYRLYDEAAVARLLLEPRFIDPAK